MELEIEGEELKNLLNRMRRIEGQARGIQKMLAEQRDCEEIIVQLSSMRSAITKVAMALMSNHLERCVLDGEERVDAEEALERAKRIFMKFS